MIVLRKHNILWVAGYSKSPGRILRKKSSLKIEKGNEHGKKESCAIRFTNHIGGSWKMPISHSFLNPFRGIFVETARSVFEKYVTNCSGKKHRKGFKNGISVFFRLPYFRSFAFAQGNWIAGYIERLFVVY